MKRARSGLRIFGAGVNGRAAKVGIAIVEELFPRTVLIDRICDLSSRGSAAPTC
jgi:hypothetical protein